MRPAKIKSGLRTGPRRIRQGILRTRSRHQYISFPNQNLTDVEFLKRPSSSSAGLCHWFIRKDLFPVHIRSHHGHERLHPPAHRPRRRPLRTKLDSQHARHRMRAPPRARGGASSRFCREWAVHYQWRDVPLVQGHSALEGGQT